MSISPVWSASARDVGVDDRLVGDGVEVGVALAPVVGIPGGRHVAVGHPVLEDEGARCRSGCDVPPSALLSMDGAAM